jgi:hypothetical protein
MTSGDYLVVQRADGLFAVYKVWANGARQPVKNHLDRRGVWHIVRRLQSEGVSFKEAVELESAVP